MEKKYLNQDGKLHNPDGPAYILYYNSGGIRSEHWMINGEYHRIDGPAAIFYDEVGTITDFYFGFDNIKYHSLEEMNKAIKLSLLK